MNTTTETAVTVSKAAVYLNHLKNNRIEYLVLALIAHSLGLFDKLSNHATGVCF